MLVYAGNVYILCEGLMIRTQIYLTEEEKIALQSLALHSGKKQSELIREAIDNYITIYSQDRRDRVMDKVAGLWKDRDDIPELESLRKSWERDVNI